MKVSFRNRVLITIGTSALICTAAAVTVASLQIEALGEADLIDKASAILSRVEVGRGYVAEMEVLEGLIRESVEKFPDGNLPESQKLKILKAVPVFAAFKIGQLGAEKENYDFRIATAEPRRKENRASPDELKILRQFESGGVSQVVLKSPDGLSMAVYRPVFL